MNRISLSKRGAGRGKQFGQGMTEYIIIVALIAIGAIAVYSAFGRTVQSQMAAVSEGLAGKGSQANTDVTQAGTEAGKADTAAGKQLGLDNYTQQDQQQ